MTIWKDLISRRVPHILGLYFAAGWAVLEFTDYIVNRFVMSPHLADFALLTWALMVPTVLVLAYFHGRPGRDEWTRFEKIAIPINVVAAAAILMAAFWGRDLGAATTEITIEDEAGQPVARVVPKGEFRKRLAIFYFDQQEPDSSLQWLQYGIPIGLQQDLLQDIFVDVRSTFPSFYERLKADGYPDGTGVPLALQREISERLHLEHFVSGTVARKADSTVVTTSLYDVSRGKLLQERTFRGSDVFQLTDEISLQLRRDLEVPEQHIEEGRDLPLAELTTHSNAAFRDYVEGIRAIEQEDWREAADRLEAAVADDPAYAFANFTLFVISLFLNDVERAEGALEAARQHSYKLPERIQFAMKANHYLLVKQDPEKARAVAEMHAELFPEDIIAYEMQLQLAQSAGDREKAIEAATRILDLDPGELDMLLVIGGLYRELGNYEEGARYYRQFADEAPRDARGFRNLGSLSAVTGDHTAALEHYERALVIDPDNVSVLTGVASTESALGRFDRAAERLEEAIEVAETPEARASAHNASREYYERRGQMRRAVEQMELRWRELDRGLPPLLAMIQKLEDIDTYVDAGAPERAEAVLARVHAEVGPPFDQLVAIGEVAVAEALEDTVRMRSALKGLEGAMENLGLEALEPLALTAHGYLLEHEGDCEQALIAYERAHTLAPAEVGVYKHIARCYRKLGRNEEAIDALERILTVTPFSAKAHLEMARVMKQAGQNDEARRHLETAIEVWSDADPEYRWAREARDELADLNLSAAR